MEINGFAQAYSYSSAGGETTRETSSESSESSKTPEPENTESASNVDVKA